MKFRKSYGAAALLVFFFAVGSPDLMARSFVAKVIEVEGGVELDRGNLLLAVREREDLHEGDLITTDNTGRVLIQWTADGSLIKMAVNSELKIIESDEMSLAEETTIFLERGLMWGKKEKSRQVMKIETSLVTLGIRGTEYFVKTASGLSELAVKEGRVLLEKEGVEAGDMTRVLFELGVEPVFYGLSREELEAWIEPFA